MKRIIVLVVCILTIGTLIGGNVYWNQKVEATVEKAKASLNQDNSSSKGSSESKNSTEKGTDSNNNSKSSDAKSNNSTVTTDEDSKSSNEDEGSETDTDIKKGSDKQKSVDEIKKEYNSLFTELEAQENSKVDQLIVEAKGEYVSKKSSKNEIIAKYDAVSQQLEAKADQNFNVIYQQLQYDLENNGHSLNEAQEYQGTYNSKKESRANRITSSLQKF